MVGGSSTGIADAIKELHSVMDVLAPLAESYGSTLNTGYQGFPTSINTLLQ